MEIVDLSICHESFREQAAALLVEGFREPSGWKNLTAARAEVDMVIEKGFARAMVSDEAVLGWVGGLPQYDGRVWELHPMVVRADCRRRGIGRMLVKAFEMEAARRGALTATLGTDDDSGMTSLSHVDLYGDLPSRISDLRDHGRGHPFLFYLACGFVVTGVMPDANGLGLPDIYMSKRIRGDDR